MGNVVSLRPAIRMEPYVGIGPVFGRSYGIPDLAAIIAIINGLTGGTDTTYVAALNTLVIQQGGVGGNTREIDALNELGALLCPLWNQDEDFASETLDWASEDVTFDQE